MRPRWLEVARALIHPSVTVKMQARATPVRPRRMIQASVEWTCVMASTRTDTMAARLAKARI
jgi:hypothetical protein